MFSRVCLVLKVLNIENDCISCALQPGAEDLGHSKRNLDLLDYLHREYTSPRADGRVMVELARRRVQVPQSLVGEVCEINCRIRRDLNFLYNKKWHLILEDRWAIQRFDEDMYRADDYKYMLLFGEEE